MFVLVAIIQASSGLGIIFLVLLHSGKGGGLSDMFGGGIGAQTAGSTVVEQNLDRITDRDGPRVCLHHDRPGVDVLGGALDQGATRQFHQATEPFGTTHSVS